MLNSQSKLKCLQGRLLIDVEVEKKFVSAVSSVRQHFEAEKKREKNRFGYLVSATEVWIREEKGACNLRFALLRELSEKETHAAELGRNRV